MNVKLLFEKYIQIQHLKCNKSINLELILLIVYTSIVYSNNLYKLYYIISLFISYSKSTAFQKCTNTECYQKT